MTLDWACFGVGHDYELYLGIPWILESYLWFWFRFLYKFSDCPNLSSSLVFVWFLSWFIPRIILVFDLGLCLVLVLVLILVWT